MRPTSATIHLGHLVHNYCLLKKKSAPSNIMAVVKANAYGHGLLPVAEALYHAGCRHFAVTDVEEGVKLRTSSVLMPQDSVHIVMLSGLFGDDDALSCQQHHLTPVLSEPSHLQLLQHIEFSGGVWLKVNTGMFRIGAENLAKLLKDINNSSAQLLGIMSHLACADEPEHPLNQTQFNAFKQIQQSYQAPAFSLLNSAGIIAFADALDTDIVRPGLALYGAEPIPTQPIGLKPVMQLSAQIIQIRPVQAGDSVSYGATWTAKQPTHIAVVAMGYADGLPRLLSNQGEASHHSGRLPIVGRVCMDYCMLAVDSTKVKVGEEVIFFGFDAGVPLANDVAKQCQSIAYELFTSISPRVHRTYRKEST